MMAIAEGVGGRPGLGGGPRERGGVEMGGWREGAAGRGGRDAWLGAAMGSAQMRVEHQAVVGAEGGQGGRSTLMPWAAPHTACTGFLRMCLREHVRVTIRPVHSYVIPSSAQAVTVSSVMASTHLHLHAQDCACQGKLAHRIWARGTRI